MSYNEQNTHPRDSRLSFEPESHTYTVDGRTFRSVTTVIGDLFEKFDADYWANKKATPSRPAEQIKQEWEAKAQAARELGTEMHDRIEKYYLGADVTPWLNDPTYRHFCAFTHEYQLVPYRSEWPIFIEEYDIAGTVDFLADNGDGSLDLWDWKRSSNLIDGNGNTITANRWGKTGLHPITDIPDTSFHHYALQLSIYRHILETKYGLKIRKAQLGVFHPYNSTYYVVEVPYLSVAVKNILK